MEKKKLLVSTCLLGLPCRYDGRTVEGSFGADRKPLCKVLPALMEKYELVPFCPEIYGGLPTPRIPSERLGDGVVMRDGTDVTENFHRGANGALALCEQLGITVALLKAKSPSCGRGRIYDGTFSGALVDRDGVTAERLLSRGICVYDESELDALLKL